MKWIEQPQKFRHFSSPNIKKEWAFVQIVVFFAYLLMTGDNFYCRWAIKLVANVAEMVFCFENCSDQLWEKVVLVIEKNFWKLKAEGREFAKILRYLTQFLKQKTFLTCYWRLLLIGTIKMPIEQIIRM